MCIYEHYALCIHLKILPQNVLPQNELGWGLGSEGLTPAQLLQIIWTAICFLRIRIAVVIIPSHTKPIRIDMISAVSFSRSSSEIQDEG